MILGSQISRELVQGAKESLIFIIRKSRVSRGAERLRAPTSLDD